jgi:6-phosphogluconolactonase
MRPSWKAWTVVAVLLLLTIPFLHGQKNRKKHGGYLVYVGTYTGPTSKGIYFFRFDPASGKTTTPDLAAETINPSFLAADASGHFLYAVNEVSDYQGQKTGAVTAFSIDRKSGKLTLLNQVCSRGAGPCHVSLDKNDKYVLVANYDSGTVAVFPVLKDGRLGEASAFVQHTGHGPDPERQKGPHAHQIQVSPDNRFALAADLGLDKLLIYKFDPSQGTLAANNPAFAEVDAGSGPRHFAFTPDGRFVYVLEEMQSAVSSFAYDAQTAALRKFQTISSLPKGFNGTKEAAEIVVHPSGKFVYASNRGHDSIAVFAVAHDGKLSTVEHVLTGGKTPRGFALDPTGSYLFVGNQQSNNIVVFRIDQKTGRLKATGRVLETPTPVSLEFVAAE